jgi:hypothetical protein
MVRHEIRGPRRHEVTPGLREMLDMLSPRFRSAVHVAVDAYEKANVRYALIGGLAAGAYSKEPRTTKDIDFIVGDEAFNVSGPIITSRGDIPIEAYGIPIDSIPPVIEYRDLYERALDTALESDEPGILIVSPIMLAVTKLVGGRLHDIAAVVEMLRSESIDKEELLEIVEAYPKLLHAYHRVLIGIAEIE